MGKKRFDIQGLRAVAVVLVICDHLFHRPSGGFVGVDVFFVISGFLITGLLLREFERTGRISLRHFYLRRIRRIAPAATVVLICTVLSSLLLLASSRAQTIALDALASFFFVSNWRFASAGTDYFQIGTAVSPLQHFWSLSVEEQFYLVWPVLVLVALLLTARRRPGASVLQKLTSPVNVMMVSATLLAFGWAAVTSISDPTVAYFSTTARAWELGVGALLALSAKKFTAIKPMLRTGFAYAGMAGIAISAVVISPELPFPAPWALLPVLSTALVIVAGIGSEPKHNWLVANPVSRYIGDISYSLYLWHFPVIVFLAVFMPATSRAYFAIALLTIFGLAAATHAAIEKPLSQSPFLTYFPTRATRRDAVASWRRASARGVRIGLICMLAVAVVMPASVATYVAIKGGKVTDATSWETALIDPDASTAANEMAVDIADALNATAWPALSPSASEAAKQTPVEDKSGCGQAVAGDPMSCAFGDPSKPALVVLGDSTGITLLATVRAAYGDDYFIRGLTRAGCPMIELDTKFSSPAKRVACESAREAAVVEIERLQPAAVLVTNNYEWANPLNLRSGAKDAEGVAEWARAASSTANQISPWTGHVVFVSPPPQGKAIADCATSVSTPADCVSEIPSSWRSGSAAERSILGGKVALVDTVSWFCAPSGRCPVFAAGTPVRRDGIHTSPKWAAHIAPLFAEETADLIR